MLPVIPPFYVSTNSTKKIEEREKAKRVEAERISGTEREKERGIETNTPPDKEEMTC